MTGAAEGDKIVDFLKSVSTATRGLDFATEEQLSALPSGVALYIEELEDLLSRLSLEAEMLLWHSGCHEFHSRAKKGGGQ